MALIAHLKEERAASLDLHQESRRILRHIEQSEEYTEAGECEHPKTRAICHRYINLADSVTRKRKLATHEQGEDVISAWTEFYTRARAFHDKDPRHGDLAGFSHTMVEKIFQEIEKEESYNFPKMVIQR
jgi:hypothetical protein